MKCLASSMLTIGIVTLTGCDATPTIAKVAPMVAHVSARGEWVPTAVVAHGEIARCPAVTGSVPIGARQLGDAAAGLPLMTGSLAGIAPADYDPAQHNLNENEPDATEGDGIYLTAATFDMAPGTGPVSLVCRYGKGGEPLLARMMLLIPLTPQWARCRLVSPHDDKPASMLCRSIKPEQ